MLIVASWEERGTTQWAAVFCSVQARFTATDHQRQLPLCRARGLMSPFAGEHRMPKHILLGRDTAISVRKTSLGALKDYFAFAFYALTAHTRRAQMVWRQAGGTGLCRCTLSAYPVRIIL